MRQHQTQNTIKFHQNFMNSALLRKETTYTATRLTDVMRLSYIIYYAQVYITHLLCQIILQLREEQNQHDKSTDDGHYKVNKEHVNQDTTSWRLPSEWHLNQSH